MCTVCAGSLSEFPVGKPSAQPLTHGSLQWTQWNLLVGAVHPRVFSCGKTFLPALLSPLTLLVCEFTVSFLGE